MGKIIELIIESKEIGRFKIIQTLLEKFQYWQRIIELTVHINNGNTENLRYVDREHWLTRWDHLLRDTDNLLSHANSLSKLEQIRIKNEKKNLLK